MILSVNGSCCYEAIISRKDDTTYLMIITPLFPKKMQTAAQVIDCFDKERNPRLNF